MCILLTGCAYEVIHFADKENSWKQSNKAQLASVPSSGIHRVESGETLFSIAFRYGLDYKKVAAANRIPSPYVIYPQQKIRLIEANRVVVNTSSSAPKKAEISSSSSKKVVAKNTTSSAPTKLKTPVIPDAKNNKAVEKWQWPVNGEVIRGFSNVGVSSKGIDVKANQGDLIKAAADGTVVYAGNGLIGYGNLVILKHNDIYLSAYAYNESILVKEKQNVKAGDSIAIIGGKGEEKPLLHFEIRKDGQPINPLGVLPKIN
ncbi:peptidoglycan DD-metalloendopeptidase family protein [Marinomonas sp. C2222]|uniref:Peptidoglycan DD-metalloendopeptidase family protein n=1 Tax=Marinomonas sargassi TaxID=2984494 RepID=A0ABT2YV53_9GAMM|nr:peptidoglycan DD-metalloendopeptidase family protein [Marinomonas sargassi]MCV2403777.1 peptidoglycan DD-metalloendopeptidase family protein [Marinomonas sargassi]